jgi:hypothetical protein
MKQASTDICYLCGQTLTPPTNVDHPVMQQLFAPEIRRKHNLSQLITFKVHEACNTAYKLDEDYFVRTLMPFAPGSVAGNAIYNKALKDYRAGKQVPLMRKVLSEFDPSPSGLILPDGKVAKRFDGDRLKRVAWKMVRGLHFYHTGEVLPEGWSTVGVALFSPDQPPPEAVIEFARTHTGHGTYPGVFDYKFDKYPEANNVHFWLLLLWDRIIFQVAFHDPACSCERCETDRAPKRGRTAVPAKFALLVIAGLILLAVLVAAITMGFNPFR